MADADRGDGDGDGADDLERALSEVMGDLPDHEDFKNFDLDSDGSRDDDDTPAPPAPPVAVPASLVAYARVPLAIRDQVIEWVQRMRRSGCALNERVLGQAEHYSTHPPVGGGISSVSHDDTVFFILWTSAADRHGYAVRLDNMHRIMMTVKFRHESILVPGCQLHISNVPARMLKAPAVHLRTQMPPWCIQLRQYWQTKLYSGPRVDHELSCIVCQSVEFHACAPQPVADTSFHQCIRCGMAWHDECALDVDDEISFHEFRCPHCLAD